MSAKLYQETMLQHHRNPVGFELSIVSTSFALGENLSCGDEIQVDVKLESSVVEGLAFSGDSCAICRASASMMNKALVGKSKPAAEAAITGVSQVLTGADKELDGLKRNINMLTDEEISALFSVRAFPVRVQCALLPWKTLNEALAKSA